MTPTRVQLEVGGKRVFASALDWPGWCRAGRDEVGALDALAGAESRYSAVLAGSRHRLPAGAGERLQVVERTVGDATTDFGAPGRPAEADRGPLERAELERLGEILEACWRYLDGAAAKAPAELRKGPRGGGRDRDAILAHVFGAETAYSPKLGLRLREASPANRPLILQALSEAAPEVDPGPRRWPSRYLVRRIAWHALDHAWEIEDRSAPGT